MPKQFKPTALSRLLVAARERTGKKPRRVAMELGMPPETLSKWESGYTPNPPITGAALLARHLGITPEDLIAAALAAAVGEEVATPLGEASVPEDPELEADVRRLQAEVADLVARARREADAG